MYLCTTNFKAINIFQKKKILGEYKSFSSSLCNLLHSPVTSSLLGPNIYTYIPETNYVPSKYSVAAILLLLFMVLMSLVSVLNLLYFYISTFRSMCAVPNMTVFWSSFTSCFPDMLLKYFLNDFEKVPVAPVIYYLVSHLFLQSTWAVFLL